MLTAEFQFFDLCLIITYHMFLYIFFFFFHFFKLYVLNFSLWLADEVIIQYYIWLVF